MRMKEVGQTKQEAADRHRIAGPILRKLLRLSIQFLIRIVGQPLAQHMLHEVVVVRALYPKAMRQC